MRQRLEPTVLATCLTEHVGTGVHSALQSVESFAADYELPPAALTVFQAARRQLKAAAEHINAAALIVQQEVG